MARKCLKCGHERLHTDSSPNFECPNCGAIYAKVEAALKKNTNNESLTDEEKIKAIKQKDVIQEKDNESKSPEQNPQNESKHVVKFRESHLKQKEKVVAWGEGYIGEMMGSGDKTQHNGALVVTNERVAFYRKGILGEVLKTIPLNKITSIERKSIMGHRTIRMHTSHDQLEFKTFQKEKEQQLVEAIESGRKQPSETVQSSQKTDPMDTLKKLGELKQLGVITDEEFQEKKAVLLAKL